jgi:hypothetical protein
MSDSELENDHDTNPKLFLKDDGEPFKFCVHGSVRDRGARKRLAKDIQVRYTHSSHLNCLLTESVERWRCRD